MDLKSVAERREGSNPSGATIIKYCSCCNKEYTFSEWKKLHFVGNFEGLELRNCSCNSTISIEIE